MGLQQRFVEHKERDHFAACLTGRGQGRLVRESEVSSEPYDSTHQFDPSETDGLAVVTTA